MYPAYYRVTAIETKIEVPDLPMWQRYWIYMDLSGPSYEGNKLLTKKRAVFYQFTKQTVLLSIGLRIKIYGTQPTLQKKFHNEGGMGSREHIISFSSSVIHAQSGKRYDVSEIPDTLNNHQFYAPKYSGMDEPCGNCLQVSSKENFIYQFNYNSYHFNPNHLSYRKLYLSVPPEVFEIPGDYCSVTTILMDSGQVFKDTVRFKVYSRQMEKLITRIEDSTQKLLDTIRPRCWNKIKNNCLYILSNSGEVENPLFPIENREMNKEQNNSKTPLAIYKLLPEIERLNPDLKDISLSVYRVDRDSTIIEFRYSTRHSYEKTAADTNELLPHCKVYIPPYALDNDKEFDANWLSGSREYNWQMFWHKKKYAR